MDTTNIYAFSAQKNQLLAAIPAENLNRWQSRLELVELSKGQQLNSTGQCPEYVYFPTTAIISLLSITQEGSTAEVALVGNDGVVGISYLLGADSASNDAVVQSAGRAYRISARFIKNEVETSGGVMKVVLRYAHGVMSQMTQMAVCNRYHSLDQRLCRRLLCALDRSPTDDIAMTHELAANLLGVRREGVSTAAKKLQDAGLIRYSRGHVAVLNLAGLEEAACECYAPSKSEYRRLQPQAMAA